MTKSGALTAPRLWLVIAKSYRALGLLAEQSIANTGLCLTDFVALEASYIRGRSPSRRSKTKCAWPSGSMTAAGPPPRETLGWWFAVEPEVIDERASFT